MTGFPRLIRKELARVLPCHNIKLQDAKLEHEKTLLSRQIEATDAAIDKLVYELYELTEEEIAIVEGRNNKQIWAFIEIFENSN